MSDDLKRRYRKTLSKWLRCGLVTSLGLPLGITTAVPLSARAMTALGGSYRVEGACVADRLVAIRAAVSSLCEDVDSSGAQLQQNGDEAKSWLAQWGNWNNWGNYFNNWAKPWYNVWGNY